MFISCKNFKQKPLEKIKKPKTENITNPQKDSFVIADTFNKIDQQENEYLRKKLKPIRNNFERINALKKNNWSLITTQELDGTTEGGEVNYYYLNKNLEKIVTHEFGETFQILTEYYLLDRKISFVFEKWLKYNRPIYYDSLLIEALNNKQYFDINKSAIKERRNYFENGKLIHQVNNQGNNATLIENSLCKEESIILNNFNRVIRLKQKKLTDKSASY